MPCNPNRSKCFLNTQIVLDLSSCQGIFTFGPNPLTVPGPCGLTGLNTSICPLQVSVLHNCKGDVKLSLLDDHGCILNCIVLKCTQYKITPIVDALSSYTGGFLPGLVELYLTEPQKTHLIQISANNLNQMGKYLEFEEAAYLYRKVSECYLNLWCGAEYNGLICSILNNYGQCVETTPDILCQTGQILDFTLCGQPIQVTITQGVTFFDLTVTYLSQSETISGLILQNPGDKIYFNIAGVEFSINVIAPVQPPESPGVVSITIYYTSPSQQNQIIYSLSNNLIKSRVSALSQLCDCGKVCNNQNFQQNKTPCSSIGNCCNK